VHAIKLSAISFALTATVLALAAPAPSSRVTDVRLASAAATR